MLNQIVLVGRVLSCNTKQDVCEIMITVPRSYKNALGQYDNDYFTIRTNNCSCAEYLKKGTVLGIRGKLACESADGVIDIIAEKISFLSTKKET